MNHFKIKFLISLVLIISFGFLFPSELLAAPFKSNPFMTKIGDPSGPPPNLNPNSQLPDSGGGTISDPKTSGDLSCPVQNSYLSCGSYWNPVPFANGALCGHCRNEGNISYAAGQAGRFNSDGKPAISSNGIWPGGTGTCQWGGTAWGLDIAGPDGGRVILPTVKGEEIRWIFYRQVQLSSNGLEAIQAYIGTSPAGEKYYLQLHHTTPGSGNSGATKPGDQGATICLSCGAKHVHVQIATGDPMAGGSNWIDPLSTYNGKRVMCGG